LSAAIIYLHAITPVHSGTGQAAAVIDLPIAREKATGWPVIPASSLKGVLRALLGSGEDDARFGSKDQAGAWCFGDQRILCLPVRSFFGTFAYVTCPLALARLCRDAEALGAERPFTQAPSSVDEQRILVTRGSALARNGKVYLEDLDFDAAEEEVAGVVAGALADILFGDSPDRFTERFAIVADSVFDYLSETATEITARVRLKEDTKTVESGGLWYEEAVPAEAIFWGAVVAADHAKRNGAVAGFEELKDGLVQIGGDASTGRGLCRMVVQR